MYCYKISVQDKYSGWPKKQIQHNKQIQSNKQTRPKPTKQVFNINRVASLHLKEETNKSEEKFWRRRGKASWRSFVPSTQQVCFVPPAKAFQMHPQSSTEIKSPQHSSEWRNIQAFKWDWSHPTLAQTTQAHTFRFKLINQGWYYIVESEKN